jgi:hypothetical protein
MRTLNEEIARIKSEVVDITSKAFTGKTIQERVEEHFAKITLQECGGQTRKRKEKVENV